MQLFERENNSVRQRLGILHLHLNTDSESWFYCQHGICGTFQKFLTSRPKNTSYQLYCFKLQEQISGSFSSETCLLISVQDGEHISSPPWQFFNRFLFTLGDTLWPSGNNYTLYYSDLWDCGGFQQKTTIHIRLRPLFSWFSLSSEGCTCSKLHFFCFVFQKDHCVKKINDCLICPAFVRNSKEWFWLLRFSRAKVYFRSQYLGQFGANMMAYSFAENKRAFHCTTIKAPNQKQLGTDLKLAHLLCLFLADECDVCVFIHVQSITVPC